MRKNGTLEPRNNTRLMRQMGSKTGLYDAEAPDQWLYEMRHGKSDTSRFVAWAKSKTSAFGHDSPYCVDEHGEPLFLEHAALELSWKIQTARNVLNEVKKQGRVRTDDEGRIWLCAEIPAAHSLKPDAVIPNSNSVQSCLPGYLLDSVEKLPAEVRAQVEARYREFLEWKDGLLADGMAKLRAIADRYEDTTLQEFGLKKKRLETKPRESAVPIKLELEAEPNFVQSYESEIVQSPESTSYKAEDGLYSAKADDASFIGLEVEVSSSSSEPAQTPKRTTTTPPTPSAIKKPGWDLVGFAAAEYISVDDSWVRQLVTAAQEKTADVSAEELAQLVHLKAKTASRGRNPAGLLKTAVVNACEGESFRRLRQRLREDHAAHSAPPVRITREERIEGLAATIQLLEEFPNSVNSDELRQEIRDALDKDPELYREALAKAKGNGVMKGACA